MDYATLLDKIDEELNLMKDVDTEELSNHFVMEDRDHLIRETIKMENHSEIYRGFIIDDDEFDEDGNLLKNLCKAGQESRW